MLKQYSNGNAEITLESDGTRVISFPDELNLDYPLNIDIRVSTTCSFADNICKDFCHESALRNGKDCNWEALREKLDGLPKGIELAIGSNELTKDLYNFLAWAWEREYICNITINQGHVLRDYLNIISAINDGIIKGLGISYRSSLKWNVPLYLLGYDNTVFHVILGIDEFKDVLALREKGVRKVLLLGEKDFGFNAGKVALTTRNHREWYWWVRKLFETFEVVSFDNLAIEQLNLKRFFTDKNWKTFNQGEHSFYINAVEEYFSPSSRDSRKTPWMDIQTYFKNLN